MKEERGQRSSFDGKIGDLTEAQFLSTFSPSFLKFLK